MTPSHAAKGSLRYRYYVSLNGDGRHGDGESALRSHRLPAEPIERAILSGLSALLGDEHTLLDLHRTSTAERTAALLSATRQLLASIASASASQLHVLLTDLNLRVVIQEDCIAASIDAQRLAAKLGDPDPVEMACPSRIALPVTVIPERQARGLRLVVAPKTADAPVLRDGRLIELLLRAREAQRLVMAGDHYSDQAGGVQRARYLVRLARLSFLAPDVVAAILEGRQPSSLNARRLSRVSELPISWVAQRRMFGLS